MLERKSRESGKASSEGGHEMLTLAAAEEEEGEEKKNGNDERRWRFASSRGMQSEALSALTHSLFRSRSALLRARVCRPLLSKGEETVQRRKRRTDEREREALSMDCLQQKERDSGASRAALEEEEKKSEKKERKKKKKTLSTWRKKRAAKEIEVRLCANGSRRPPRAHGSARGLLQR